MEAYIRFTNCAVVFTPSAMAEGYHTVIGSHLDIGTIWRQTG